MNTIFLITGGNLGHRKKNLEAASELIQKQVGPIIKSSEIYETEPWGLTEQPQFYNQIHVVESEFSAKEILGKILKIEEMMGRVRTIKNAARIIDIDILFFNDDIVNEQNLIIPHPQIINRRFVLTPLNELAPDKIHPVFKKSIHELLLACKDGLKAIPIPKKTQMMGKRF